MKNTKLSPALLRAHLRMVCLSTMEGSMSDSPSYERCEKILSQLGDESTKDKRVRLNAYLPSEAYMPEEDLGWGRVH